MICPGCGKHEVPEPNVEDATYVINRVVVCSFFCWNNLVSDMRAHNAVVEVRDGRARVIRSKLSVTRRGRLSQR